MFVREKHDASFAFFYCIRCFWGPIQLPSRGVLRGLESQRHDGECCPKEQRSKLYTKRQLGRSVQQVNPLLHYWGNPGSPSKSWSEGPWRGGGPFQRLLQVGLQQEWDQLSLLRMLTRVDIQYVLFMSGYIQSVSQIYTQTSHTSYDILFCTQCLSVNQLHDLVVLFV